MSKSFHQVVHPEHGFSSHRARHFANAAEWQRRLDKLDPRRAAHSHMQALRDIIAYENRMALIAIG
jgi:hypothetical protein